jgi:hypothetical protein
MLVIILNKYASFIKQHFFSIDFWLKGSIFDFNSF